MVHRAIFHISTRYEIRFLSIQYKNIQHKIRYINILISVYSVHTSTQAHTLHSNIWHTLMTQNIAAPTYVYTHTHTHTYTTNTRTHTHTQPHRKHAHTHIHSHKDKNFTLRVTQVYNVSTHYTYTRIYTQAHRKCIKYKA